MVGSRSAVAHASIQSVQLGALPVGPYDDSTRLSRSGAARLRESALSSRLRSRSTA
jgi:hypothetical protein